MPFRNPLNSCLTGWYVVKNRCNPLVIFADGAVVTGWISNNDDEAYMEEVVGDL